MTKRDEILRLRSYLEQEEAAIAEIWAETDEASKKDFVEWAVSDTPSQSEYQPEWIDFAARLALWCIQSSVLRVQ